MKKIGFVFTYKSGATLNRILSMCNVLSDHEIHLVGPLKSLQGYENYLKKTKIFFHEIPLSKNKYSNFLFRYLSEFKYSLKCSKKINSLLCDYQIISVPFISLIISSKIFNNKSCQILDIRDLVWEYYNKNRFFEKVAFKILKFIHLHFLKKYKNITLSNFFELQKLDFDLLSNNKFVISNGVSQTKFNLIQKNLDTHFNSTKTVITYIGNVGIAQNLWSFIKVIKDFKMLQFYIVGDGNDYLSITKKLVKNKIKNVKLVGNVFEKNVIKYYTNTDFLYAKLDSKYSTAIPSKLYEYLSTGKPIIYSGEGASIEFLKKFENIFIINNNEKDINSFLMSINKINFTIKSKKNIEIIEQNYIRENISLKLLDVLKINKF